LANHVYKVVDDAGDVDVCETPPKSAGRLPFGADERGSDIADTAKVELYVETGSLLGLRWKLAPGW
jgi:hypothetical protein